MNRLATLILIALLVLSSLIMVGAVFAQSVPKPSVPEFTLKFVDKSYDVPAIYEIDQYTGENVTIEEGYNVDNRSIEFTFKNQLFASYTDSSGNNIKLYYNFRFKGNYGDEWTYYPEDSNGWTVIHYGGGIQADDTKMYPPFYAASNSDYTAVSLRLGLLGPPVGSQVIPDGTEVNFQTQALIGYFERNEHGYYILTGETGDWSETQTLTIPEIQTPYTFPEPTIPTSPSPLPSEEPQQLGQDVILGVAVTIAIVCVGLGLLLYRIKRR